MESERAKRRLQPSVRLARCQEWIMAQNAQTETESESASLDFLRLTELDDEEDAADKCSDNEYNEIVQSKIQRLLRKKNVADEILNLECEWNKCNHSTNNYRDFQVHVKAHMNEVDQMTTAKGENIFTCLWTVCQFESENFQEITRHVHFHVYHTKLKAVGRNVRERYGFNECNLDCSLRNQIDKIPWDYFCKWTGCDMRFNGIQQFVDHIQCHLPGADVTSDKMVLCGWFGCQQRFRDVNKLRIHSRKHTGEKVTACYHCGRTFASNAMYEDHCTRQIAATPDYRCDMCGKSFPSERLMRNHHRRHVNSFKCSFCDMTCSAPSGLIRHIRYCHLDYKPFECHHCPFKAVSKLDLNSHIRILHEGIKKNTKQKMLDDDNSETENSEQALSKMRIYACHCCENYFNAGRYLTKHLIKHHGFTRASGFQRFRYEQASDGYYRLIPVRYESLEVSNQIIEEQKQKNNTPTAGKECTDERDFKLVLFKKGTTEEPASYALMPSTSDKDRLLEEDVLKNSSVVQKNSSTKSKEPVAAKKPSKTKRDYKRTNKRQTVNGRNSKVTTQNRAQKRPRETGSAPSPALKKARSIQISISEVDHEGNVIKSEVMESHELVVV